MTETAQQRRARHMKWIELNHKTFVVDAPRAYEELGRGMYVVVAKPGPPGLESPEYLTLEGLLERVPPDRRSRATVRRLSQMIRSYDPTQGFVVAILEPDYSIHAYSLGRPR